MISLPPPPPPYVAPDIRLIAAEARANIILIRDKKNGPNLERMISHGVWMAAEGAPLEVRFHRSPDGKVWAEQAFYLAGDRGTGTASSAASANLARLDDGTVAGMGRLRNLVRFTVTTASGATASTWTSAQCAGTDGLVRLDRPDSPPDPTYPSAWDSCGSGGAYTLGRLFGVDRGWATPVARALPKTVNLKPGRYRLTVTVNEDRGIADSNAANDSVTVPLTVKVATTSTRYSQGVAVGSIPTIGPGGRVVERHDASPRGRFAHRHANGKTEEHVDLGGAVGRREPDWIDNQLRELEAAVAKASAEREAGGRPRAGETPPTPPAGVDLPNLRSAPSYGIRTRSARVRGKRRDYVDFGALTWNAGPGRLEVEAFRESGTTLDAYQVFFKDGARQARQARGTLLWHAAPGHDHFHFQAFAQYKLTKLDGQVVRDSGKNSWCIVETDVVDTTLPGVPNPSLPGEATSMSGCGSEPGALWARMSMPVGGGDYYVQSIAGQSFDITNVRNGLYRIQITANPDGIIAEQDHTDNASTRVIGIGGKPGMRTVFARKNPILNENDEDDFTF